MGAKYTYTYNNLYIYNDIFLLRPINFFCSLLATTPISIPIYYEKKQQKKPKKECNKHTLNALVK